MAKIAPFRALRYNAEKIADLNNVMAPPYDVKRFIVPSPLLYTRQKTSSVQQHNLC